MSEVAAELPEDRQVWLRAFYGFSPEEAGYLGFTYEPQRETMLERMRDGDLVLIYGAVDHLTDTSLKRQALGFLEVTGERCSDRERSAPPAIDWKEEHGFLDRWTFGVKVRRAWRVRNRVRVNTIAPEAYANENRFERTTRAILLTPEERERALSHPVFQVNVYGEPSISEAELAKGVMGELLKPSRGFPPSLGTRTATHEDGENNLYLMMLEGGAEALLGRTGSHVGKALVKVGRSNDPKRRLKEVNGGFPENGTCRWKLVNSQAFPDVSTAHRHEDELKDLFKVRFSSQGGEFFTADKREIENEFMRFCVSKMPAIKSAPGKAKGIN
ncbi:MULTISPECIES: GIY-YIG nuclease family protein [unclassified Mesorhizobium]|uniref:GIY-YIG nuclease family protein n=1 Tax=unclassified Mesorhizobium TaxID=325217 RepID=UPI0033377FF9